MVDEAREAGQPVEVFEDAALVAESSAGVEAVLLPDERAALLDDDTRSVSLVDGAVDVAGRGFPDPLDD